MLSNKNKNRLPTLQQVANFRKLCPGEERVQVEPLTRLENNS